MKLMRTKTAPEIYVSVEDKELGMTGFLVVESTAVGPGKGGMRMTSNVTLEEVARLADTMTWKSSLFELPFGGAKSGIVWNGGSDEKKLTKQMDEIKKINSKFQLPNSNFQILSGAEVNILKDGSLDI